MCFEVRGLDGNHTIIGRMALVESIPRKLFPVTVDGFGDVLRHAILYGTGNKLTAMLIDLFLILLRDGFSQFI